MFSGTFMFSQKKGSGIRKGSEIRKFHFQFCFKMTTFPDAHSESPPGQFICSLNLNYANMSWPCHAPFPTTNHHESCFSSFMSYFSKRCQDLPSCSKQELGSRSSLFPLLHLPHRSIGESIQDTLQINPLLSRHLPGLRPSRSLDDCVAS